MGVFQSPSVSGLVNMVAGARHVVDRMQSVLLSIVASTALLTRWQ
jgi:hypothetical protein